MGYRPIDLPPDRREGLGWARRGGGGQVVRTAANGPAILLRAPFHRGIGEGNSYSAFSAARNASPYLSSLAGPTPDTSSNSAFVLGIRSIMFHNT